MKIDLQTVVLLGVIAFFAMRGCEKETPGPGPGPDPEPKVLAPREAAAKSIDEYGERLAAVYDAAAEAIDSGSVASDADLYRFTEITKAAREEAFKPFDAASEENIPDGKWDESQADRVKQFCRDAAAGFRE